MVNVAVAGGTGSIGGAIVDAIAATKKHNLFVFSRQESSSFRGAEGVSVVVVDYASPDSITGALSRHRVHTVISCIRLNSEGGNISQLNLIRAAEECSTVRRFAPSEYGIDYLKSPRLFPDAEYKVAAIEVLRNSRLIYTRFITGTFMDYFGPPAAPTHLQMVYLVIDHQNRKAAIPGDGNKPVALTHSADVGKFVAASLDLPEWDDASVVIGDKLSLREVVQCAEEAMQEKFEVLYDSIENLQAGEITDLPCNEPLYDSIPKEMVAAIRKGAGLAMAQGFIDLDSDGELLNSKFPGLHAMSVKEFFSKYSNRHASA